jgi:4a-hydroxytetrahydrobiopterin dehydratase
MGRELREVAPTEFETVAGVADWRVVGDGACAFYAADSFAAGAGFVASIATLDGLGPHQPDVDLRHDGAYVRLITYTADLFGLTDRDLELARAISALAREHGLRADPARLQTVQVTIDALDSAAVLPFWRALLDYEVRADSPDDLIDPRWRSATIWFQPMDAPREQRNRIHLDVWVPKEDVEKRVAAALAAGGHLVSAHPPTWWVLADAEGNEACVTSIAGRDQR